MPRLVTVVDPFGVWRAGARLGAGAVDAAVGAAGHAAVGIAERAVHAAIREGLVERVVDDLIDSGAIDRMADRVLSTPLPQHIADRLMAGGVAEQVAERVVAGPEIDRLLVTALDSPRVSELVARMLESPGMERLVAQVLDSRLVDAAVAQLLAGDELWQVVEEVARSPAVTEAITHQSVGFADQVAVEVGERSRKADARLERAARRLLRRSVPAQP